MFDQSIPHTSGGKNCNANAPLVFLVVAGGQPFPVRELSHFSLSVSRNIFLKILVFDVNLIESHGNIHYALICNTSML